MAGKKGDPGVVCVGEVCSPPSYNGPGEVPMRRLNNAEYANTISDLFGTTSLSVTFPDEGKTHGFDTLYTALAVSPLHIDAYIDAADEVVAELFASDPHGISAAWCDYSSPDAAANQSCAETIVSEFAALAWRRPLDSWPDGQASSSFLELLKTDGALAEFPLQTRLSTALSAVLVSPRFVFRVEFAGGGGQLEPHSLASRMSYFLWSSAPDAELLSSDLTEDDALLAQVARMQADAKFSRFRERFTDLWLRLDELDSIERDPELYPDYTPELGAMMGEETRNFVGGFINDPLAPVTGILSETAPPPQYPELLSIYGDSPRRGLVTQASILTLTAVSNRTAPVRRGMWVLEALLCDPPPDPPADVIAIINEQNDFDPNLTERERLQIHREEPSCASCHVTMDAIGLGFENYDAVGAYREVYPNGAAVEAGGVLPGVDEPFEEPMELVGLLAEDVRFPSCVVRQLLTYGAGRVFEGSDDTLVDVVHEFAGGSEMSFLSALSGVVLSDGFRSRDESKGEVQ